MNTKCPKCHTKNPPESKFCMECATPFPGAGGAVPTQTLETPLKGLAKGSTVAEKYKILEVLGRGGMGIVYKAEDTKLKRTVALKFLSPELTQNPEAKERFILEAQAASALEHNNICTVYEIDESDGQMFIAMAYVDGQSLKEKIIQGPLKLKEALDMATQIASGLHEAHEKGIVHRDIKSANIMVTAKDQAMIMDFGIAKLSGETKITRTGTTMGTVAYMSPEQARGEKVDHKTDIWSLGVVLYEMILGQLPFKGDHEQAVMYSILNEHPEPMTGLRTGVPMELERIVSKALQKDFTIRYQNAVDMLVDLRYLKENLTAFLQSPVVREPSPSTPQPKRWKHVLSWSLICLVGLTAAFLVLLIVSKDTSRRGVQGIRRFHVELPQALSEAVGQGIVLSPGGDKLVYLANIGQRVQQYLPAAGQTEIHVRHLDQLVSSPLAGTRGASHSLAFSPDGQWLCFATKNELKKISIAGGTAQILCEELEILGTDWGANDTIVFGALSRGGLMRVSSAGGEIQELTALEEGEYAHLWPQLLPGGQRVLFNTGKSADFREANIEVLSLQTGERKVVYRGGYYPRYLPIGYLVFTRESTLYAARFDLDNLELSSLPTPVLEGVWSNPRHGNVSFTFSQDRTIVYLPERPATKRVIVWVDRNGNEEPFAAEPGFYYIPRISPDGSCVVMSDTVSFNQDLWIYDLDNQTSSRLTFDPASDIRPVWTSDGQRIMFSSNRDEVAYDLYWRSADGTGEVERLTSSPNTQYPHFWSLDGKTLVFEEIRPKTVQDLYVLSMEGERSSGFLLQTEFTEDRPALSPNGSWMAYRSNESGRFEIYVRPFPNVEKGKWKVSTDGGTSPVWGPNGRELFYRDLTEGVMMLVKVETESMFTHQDSEVLFTGNYWRSWGRNYDISPDGQRFLMLKEVVQTVETDIHLVLVQNWFDELKRLVPPEK